MLLTFLLVLLVIAALDAMHPDDAVTMALVALFLAVILH